MAKKTRAKKHIGWTRLDNAAKIFPPTSDKRDSKVFRFSCELFETIKPALLQTALDQTLPYFRGYLSVLRYGFFWYYLEATELRPRVHLEDQQVCNPLYDRNEQSLLFDVSYYRHRINLEIYHALADGTGALEFLKELVCQYLSLAHPQIVLENEPLIGMDASPYERMADSFQKYYDSAKPKGDQLRRAYRFRGSRMPEDRPKVIEGLLPVDKIHAVARSHKTTITVLLSAVLICSVLEGMTMRERKRPVTVVVPVNLRNFFPSESVRNFFGVTYISYLQSSGVVLFEEVVKSVDRQLKENLSKERLQAHMNNLVSLEKNLLIRAVPLLIKDTALRIANEQTNAGVTIALSNIGRISMPPAYEDYIRLFDIMTSTKKLQVCMCSYRNNMLINFTDTFVSTAVQKRFFRALADMGIPITLTSTPMDEEATHHETL